MAPDGVFASHPSGAIFYENEHTAWTDVIRDANEKAHAQHKESA
jgi:hypothetical protein